MPGSVSGQGGQLLAECQVLGDEARPPTESRDERADDGFDQRQHHARIATPGALVTGESESRIGYAGPPAGIPSTRKTLHETNIWPPQDRSPCRVRKGSTRVSGNREDQANSFRAEA
jgi:hypothetical protein